MEYSVQQIFNIIKNMSQEEMNDFIELRTSILSNQNNTKIVIGPNKFADKSFYSGLNSAENNFFTPNSLVCIEAGLGDIVYCTTGDLTEAYKMFVDKIRQSDGENFEDIMELVYGAVVQYFGDTSRHQERMDYYPDEDLVEYNNESRGEISNLAGKNIAMCVERAMLSHNLMKLIGIYSTYKASGILNDNNQEVHAYNIVRNNDKAYIFDSTIPKGIGDGRITPLVTEITLEQYEKICSPKQAIGCAVKTKYFSPLSGRDREITYDAGHPEIIKLMPKEECKSGYDR